MASNSVRGSQNTSSLSQSARSVTKKRKVLSPKIGVGRKESVPVREVFLRAPPRPPKHRSLLRFVRYDRALLAAWQNGSRGSGGTVGNGSLESAADPSTQKAWKRDNMRIREKCRAPALSREG